MEEKELELMAYNNEPIPELTAFPEQLLFSLYRNLYSTYRRGEITEEQAKREKRIIRAEYLKAKSHYDQWVDGCRGHQQRIRESESALSELVKQSGKISEHELLLQALHCISLLAGESVTEQTVLKKLGEDKGRPRDQSPFLLSTDGRARNC
ncbi:MAG: hypothetical protein ACLU8W_05715 [Clostridia bacterium]